MLKKRSFFENPNVYAVESGVCGRVILLPAGWLFGKRV
jgi:hypothetical protein